MPSRRRVVAGLVATAAAPRAALALGTGVATGTPAAAPQTIASVSLDNLTFIPDGVSAKDVGNVVVVMSPTTPAATGGSITIGGTHASSFQLTNSGNIPCKVQAKSTTAAGTYSIALTYTQSGISNSPFTGSTIAPVGSAAPGLTAEITFPGGVPTASTLVYDVAAGTDMGDYVAPTAGFTQKCIRVRHASLTNFFVDFRYDTTGGRIEVVFWNGECDPTGLTVASGYTRNLAQYTAVVKNAGVAVADWEGNTSKSVWFHNWGNRWRFFTAWRSFTRTAAEIFSDNLLPPMSAAAARLSGYSGVIVPPVPLIPTAVNNTGSNGDSSATTIGTTPFDSSGAIYRFPMLKDPSGENLLGIQCPGDQGGYRPEIGMVTEWQAHWLLSGNTDCLNVFMMQAEFASSQWNGFFLPDKPVGGPLNQKSSLAKYKATMYSYGSYYMIQKGSGQYISKGDEHSPQMWYIPWCLTEDPYYIEAQQYHENYATLMNIYGKENNFGNLTADPTGATGWGGAFTVFSNPADNEERAIGWSLKNVASAWVMSPTSPPSWLLPKSYWESFSSDFSAVIDHYADAHPTDQFYTVFRSMGYGPANSDTPQTFYKGYNAYCIGFADFVGCPAGSSTSWHDQLIFMFEWFRQTCDSTLASGWNVQSPIVYNLGYPTFMSNQGGAPSGCTASTSTTPPTGINCYDTYGELWTAVADFLGNGAYYPSGASPRYQGASPGNLTTVIAAAAVAKSLGVTGATNVFNFINSMIDDSFPAPLIDVHFRAQDGFTGA